MKRSVLILALALFITLAACKEAFTEKPPESGEISVYRVVKEESRVSGELLRAEAVKYSDISSAPRDAAAALRGVPEDSALMNALPSGIGILSAELKGSVVDVRMSASYGRLAGIEKTLADACIALTMCSIPNVDFVSIHAEDRPAEGLLSSEDIVLGNTLTNEDEIKIRLYFPRENSPVLAAEYRAIKLNDDFSAERTVISELLKGPESGSLIAAFPKDTVVLSVYTQDGVCTVNFAEEFPGLLPADPDAVRLTVYSLVNSLTCLKDVDSVMITIQNNPGDGLGGMDISEPLTRKVSMIGAAATLR